MLLSVGLIGKTLLESLHLVHGSELQIINRGRTYRYRRAAVYGRHTFYLPLSKIASAAWEEDARDSAVVRLILKVPGGQFQFSFIRENPSLPSYASMLEKLFPGRPGPVPGRVEQSTPE